MFRTWYIVRNLTAIACAWSLALPAMAATDPITPAEQKAVAPQDAAKEGTPGVTPLVVTVGKSLIIDSPIPIKRFSSANGALVDIVAIDPKQILLNGKAPGETSLTIWQQDDTRLIYDLTVRVSPTRLNAVREQIARDYPDADINVSFANETAFVRGTVKDSYAADRIIAIVATLARPINLLRVEVPAVEPQIQLKVRFANVDRNVTQQLGINFASTAFNQTTGLGTAGGTLLPTAGLPITSTLAGQAINSAVNIFALRPDINLLTEIQALESKNMLEMLAEPTLLTYSGTRASFTAGGQFPYLTPQPSAGAVTYTITFKDYGVLLSFLPRITPQGTIHMQLTPEVSALDYTNTVTIQGTAVPGLTLRRVSDEVDLESGQTLIIAGLLDKQTTETLSKIPGLGDIPILGKLFQSRVITKSNSELLIMVTPELVRPIPAGQVVPELKWTKPFMTDNSPFPMRQPGIDVTGPVPVHPPSQTLRLEELQNQQKLLAPSPLTAPSQTPVGTPATATPMAPATPPGGGGGAAAAGGGGGAPAGGGGAGNGQ